MWATCEHVGYIPRQHLAGRGKIDRRRLGVSVHDGVISNLLPIRKYCHRLNVNYH